MRKADGVIVGNGYIEKYAKFSGKAYVDDILIAQGTWTSLIVNNTKE